MNLYGAFFIAFSNRLNPSYRFIYPFDDHISG